MKASAETERFEKKRQDVIDAASVLINEQGVKGMTFADVAAEVGLNATSITYYFGRKEKLVVAVYEATLDRLEAMAAEAMAGLALAELTEHSILEAEAVAVAVAVAHSLLWVAAAALAS